MPASSERLRRRVSPVLHHSAGEGTRAQLQGPLGLFMTCKDWCSLFRLHLIWLFITWKVKRFLLDLLWLMMILRQHVCRYDLL